MQNSSFNTKKARLLNSPKFDKKSTRQLSTHIRDKSFHWFSRMLFVKTKREEGKENEETRIYYKVERNDDTRATIAKVHWNVTWHAFGSQDPQTVYSVRFTLGNNLVFLPKILRVSRRMDARRLRDLYDPPRFKCARKCPNARSTAPSLDVVEQLPARKQTPRKRFLDRIFLPDAGVLKQVQATKTSIETSSRRPEILFSSRNKYKTLVF